MAALFGTIKGVHSFYKHPQNNEIVEKSQILPIPVTDWRSEIGIMELKEVVVADVDTTSEMERTSQMAFSDFSSLSKYKGDAQD
jgi:hypothetical protein